MCYFLITFSALCCLLFLYIWASFLGTVQESAFCSRVYEQFQSQPEKNVRFKLQFCGKNEILKDKLFVVISGPIGLLNSVFHQCYYSIAGSRFLLLALFANILKIESLNHYQQIKKKTAEAK